MGLAGLLVEPSEAPVYWPYRAPTPAVVSCASVSPSLSSLLFQKSCLSPRLPQRPCEQPVPKEDNRGAISWVSSGILAVVLVRDRKSTRLNSSHLVISYAVF